MSGETPEVPNPAEMASAAGAQPAPTAPPVGVGDAAAASANAAGESSPAAPAVPELEASLLEGVVAEEAAAKKAGEAAEGEKKETAPPAEGEKKPAEGAKPGEGEAAPVVEVPAVDYKFETPAGMSLSTEQTGELKAALDAFRSDPVKGVQGLVDLHAKAMQQYADQSLVRQYEVFNDTRKEWREQVVSDEQLGGSGHKTTMRSIARMRDRFVPEKNRPAFDAFLRTTGAGDHPEFLRLLHNVAGAFDEPPLPPPNVMPPPDLGRKPGASKSSILYGSK